MTLVQVKDPKALANFRRKETEILAMLDQFQEIYGFNDETRQEIEEHLAPMWCALPGTTSFHSLPKFIDIVAFHVLKERGLYEEKKFRRASRVGTMPMHERRWLLTCTRHVAPSTRVDTWDVNEETRERISALGPDFSRIFDASYRLLGRVARYVTKRVRTGMAVYLACEVLGLPRKFGKVEKVAGAWSSSVVNAFARLADRNSMDRDELVAKLAGMVISGCKVGVRLGKVLISGEVRHDAKASQEFTTGDVTRA